MRKATFVSLATLLVSMQAWAQEAAEHAATAGAGMGDKGLYALGLGLMLGLGAFGATTGQGRVGASAMEGLARNPQARNSMFVPMIVVLALIESLFILTWLIASGMSGKI
ncbi:MAG: ATP synthase F0 subunit C [Bdellovibrionales bacterium]